MTFSNETIFLGGFAVFTIFVMLLDLGVFSKSKDHVVKFNEAGLWSAVWVSLAILFYFFLRNYGHLVHDVADMAHLQQIKDRFYPAIDFTGDDYTVNLKLFQKVMFYNVVEIYYLCHK